MASIDYRLGEAGAFPAAGRWPGGRALAGDWQDRQPGRVGRLSLMAALSPADPGGTDRIDAVVDCCGPTDLVARLARTDLERAIVRLPPDACCLRTGIETPTWTGRGRPARSASSSTRADGRTRRSSRAANRTCWCSAARGTATLATSPLDPRRHRRFPQAASRRLAKRRLMTQRSGPAPTAPSSSEDPAEFWENLYRRQRDNHDFRGVRVNPRPVEAAEPLQPGIALDLAGGAGGDTLWLARRGWRVTATDISATAVEKVLRLAKEEALGGLVTTERHDLAETFPGGRLPGQLRRTRPRSPGLDRGARRHPATHGDRPRRTDSGRHRRRAADPPAGG
nr:hypothetical protein [Amycolatopsis sp. M39]